MNVWDDITPIDPIVAEQVVVIDYTNWRGERTMRRIIPKKMVYTSTEWHPERQWFVVAFDLVKNDDRNFAMKDIHQWIPMKNQGTTEQ